MGQHKLKVAIFDNDNVIRTLKKYPVSENGKQIQIISGGAGHFMPSFDANTVLHFPSWKKYFLFGERTYKPLYIVANKGKKCVDFKTGEVSGPDLEQLKISIASTELDKIGKPEEHFPSWLIWATFGITLINVMILLATSGIIRGT